MGKIILTNRSPEIATKTSDLTNDTNFISDSNYVHTDNNFTDEYKENIEANNAKISNVQADWNATTGESVILNKPTDLGKVDDVKVNGETVVSNKIANIAIPSKVSELTNDLNYIDSTYHDSTKQDTIEDLESIKSGAQKGATALQSYTETDPTVPDWAKQSTKPAYSASEVGALADTTTHLSGDIASSEKGANNGVATLGSDGKIPSSQLPSYVDDVLEYSSKSEFPATGESGKIYVDTTTSLTYRWSGSAYVEISPSLALGETSSTAYAGDKGKANADAISTHTSNSDIHVTSANKTEWSNKYDKPSTGIPKTDLASDVQTSLGKADSALQSYTESDPIYSASPASGITSNDITNWNGKTSNVGTVTSVAVSMNGSTKGTITDSGTINLGTIITEHQDISGKQDKITSTNKLDYSLIDNTPTIPDVDEIIEVSSSPTTGKVWVSDDLETYDTIYTKDEVDELIDNIDLSSKQDVLVSGTNIKTINSNSLLGEGNIGISVPTKTSELTNDSGFLTVSDLLTVIYPVGSIYMSINSVSPSTFIGGTWEQITDMFLLGAGSSYSLGNTGGEATHTLTIAEMPSHAHSYTTYSNLKRDGEDNYQCLANATSGTTGYTGGGKAHNNMPPYLAVNIWKRTA